MVWQHTDTWNYFWDTVKMLLNTQHHFISDPRRVLGVVSSSWDMWHKPRMTSMRLEILWSTFDGKFNGSIRMRHCMRINHILWWSDNDIASLFFLWNTFATRNRYINAFELCIFYQVIVRSQELDFMMSFEHLDLLLSLSLLFLSIFRTDRIVDGSFFISYFYRLPISVYCLWK